MMRKLLLPINLKSFYVVFDKKISIIFLCLCLTLSLSATTLTVNIIDDTNDANPDLGSLSRCNSNGVGVLPITSGSTAENAGDVYSAGFIGKQDGIMVSLPINTIPYSHIVTDETIQYFINFRDPTTDACEIASVLPVELTFFKGSVQNEGIQLVWQTASEFNNFGLEIERFINGVDFEKIGFVDGRTTTNEVNDYSFIDETPSLNNYYRLKQVDFDGAFKYSNIVNIKYRTRNNELRIFPNPVEDKLTITGGEGIATIHNVLGQPLRELMMNN